MKQSKLALFTAVILITFKVFAVETVLLAVDGLSYYSFLEGQKQGLFKEFKNVGANVAPFPTMTDLSWATFTKTADLFGSAGRIKSVEATYFDESTQSIQGDPRDYYRRLSFPKYYLNAFDSYFNPYVEALMYFPTEEIPKLEIKTVVDELLSSKSKKLVTGYIGAIDSTAHTQFNRLYPVMKVLDTEIKRLIKSFADKNQDVEIILVSDHGNVGRFSEGQAESELQAVDLGKTFEKYGFNFTQQLTQEKDISAPLMALGTWAPLYLKERKNIPTVIQNLKQEPWFDLAVQVNQNNQNLTRMTVYSTQGSAQIQYNKKSNTYIYINQSGNPLQIPDQYISTSSNLIEIDSANAFKITASTNYPDSLARLIESASERNFDFPDLILTLKDGFYIQSGLGAFTKMYRTHGSLSAKSSYGLLASTKRQVPGQSRTKDILDFLKIDAKELFKSVKTKADLNGRSALSDIRLNNKNGIETLGRDFSQKRIFQHISRFVSDTRPYFIVNEMKSFMEAFKFDPFKNPNQQTLSSMNFDVSKFDGVKSLSPQDIGTLTDAVIQAGSIEKLMKDPRIESIKEKVGLLEDQAQNPQLLSLTNSGSDVSSMDEMIKKISDYILPSKRAVMKMYQLPYLLEKSIVLQEKTHIKDTRDLQFADYWINNQKNLSTEKRVFSQSKENEDPEDDSLKTSIHLNPYARLFKETLKEADLEDRIYPTAMTKIYNSKLNNTTIVYIPGIYNSIFDTEIFSLGLNALKEELGLRVIQPPVESICSSDYNADIILNFLKKDMNDQILHGNDQMKYVILGYSKGAVDALYSIIKNKELISQRVQAFVAIAAPLQGSSILNVTDLPFTLINALSEKKGPSICQTEKMASKSITPTAMESFWRKNERSLIGLTRYFSVTFESDPEDSHIFMKATKMIAQFDENNDGVVTVTSSKFPEKLQAVDLGTLKADHLAGILSSRFNQKAFMKGLVQTLSELEIDHNQQNTNWNTHIILDEANTSKWKNKTIFSTKKPNEVTIYSLGSINSKSFISTYELNKMILPEIVNIADSYEVKTKLPGSQLKYDPYSVLDVQKLPEIMSKTKVSPVTKSAFPQGIQMNYDHKSIVHFRMDHQFNYESRSPRNLDDNKDFGFVTSDFANEKNWALMKSVNNSIRMTTLSYRFSPLDFPNMKLKLAVTKGVTGADPVKGKTGLDDSAFQVWFTIREGRSNGDRTLVDSKNDQVFLFGYYWGDPVQNESRKPQEIFENWYSNKNIVVATLPEAKQLLLNDQSMLGQPMLHTQNLVNDLKRAFPQKNIEDMEIVAITIQHDSNDAKDSSEAYFKSLQFLP